MQELLIVCGFIALCFFLACRSCVLARFWSLDRYADGVVIEKTRITPSDYANLLQHADVFGGIVYLSVCGVVSIRLPSGEEQLFLVETESCWKAIQKNMEISFHYYNFFSTPVIIELDAHCKGVAGDFSDLAPMRA